MATDIATVSKKLAQHQSTVSPGLAYHFTAANTPLDTHRQGDLYICITDAQIPEDYVEIKNPTDRHRQLAVELGEGSHHRIRSLDGVRIFHPRNWGVAVNDLRGPYVIFSAPNAIVHEREISPHGTLFIDAAMRIVCHQQRNLTADGRAERARD